MFLFSLAILSGLALLIWSADRFVNASVSTAIQLGMSPLMVGLTVVAFGTSAPELIVSATAALSDASNLAVGNAIGSNIANVGLVIGCTALISAIPIKKALLKNELPILLLATALASWLIYDLYLSKTDGVWLFVILILAMVAIALRQDTANSSDLSEAGELLALPKALIWLTASLAGLLISSKALVWGATGIASALGVSDLVIGLTIVAIGTSLPELAASVASALKGHHDLALGNVIGSNLFNLLAVLGVAAVISPPEIDRAVLTRDYGTMVLFTFAMAAIAYLGLFRQRLSIGRLTGALLLLAYLYYLWVLYQAAI